MKDQYLTVKEFSEILKIKPRGITRLIRLGRIHAMKIGKGKSPYRIPYHEIDRLLKMSFEKTLESLKPILEENNE